MVQYNYSIIAFVLGVVLGPIAEENFMRSLQLSDGSYAIFVDPTTHPLAFIITFITLMVLVGPFLKPRLEQLFTRSG